MISPSRQNLKTQPVAKPNLPLTTQPLVLPISVAPCTINGYECDFLNPSPRMMMKNIFPGDFHMMKNIFPDDFPGHQSQNDDEEHISRLGLVNLFIKI